MCKTDAANCTPNKHNGYLDSEISGLR
uniref:Uncharacterized protein n=1 Tax=Anguilla anguilla TaxID=7936 RepID=A0A0E9PDU8_ANGAN